MNESIAVEKIAQWQKLKGKVLDNVSSPITKRVYNTALNEFMEWFQQAPRSVFTKATVSAWRIYTSAPSKAGVRTVIVDTPKACVVSQISSVLRICLLAYG